MREEKILQYLRVLCYLKSQSPDYVPRRELAERFFGGNCKKLESVCKHLIDARLISSKPGTSGGYTYDPTFKLSGLSTSEVNTCLNEYTYSNKAELNKVNISISDNEVIERVSKLTAGGIPLISNLKIDNFSFSPKEEQLMLDITDAIRGGYKIRVHYVSSQLKDDGSINEYDCTLCPINFIMFNGAAYLYAYYEKTNREGELIGERVRRTFVLNRLSILKHLENDKFVVSNDDRIRIKNKLPYELYDQDYEIKFPIKLNYMGYNCFNRVFKNYYYNDVRIDEPSCIVYIVTKSYFECVGNLLALGNTFEFIELKLSKPIRDLYLKTVEELRDNLLK